MHTFSVLGARKTPVGRTRIYAIFLWRRQTFAKNFVSLAEVIMVDRSLENDGIKLMFLTLLVMTYYIRYASFVTVTDSRVVGNGTRTKRESAKVLTKCDNAREGTLTLTASP